MLLRRLTVLLLLLLSCVSSFSLVSAQDDPLNVVVTYSILGDLVQNVAGDNIELTVLVGPDGDPHVYEPTPQDAIALAEADILFENGLEFETWLDDLYEASGSTAARIVVSEGIEPLAFEGHDHGHEHAEEGAEAGEMLRLAVNDYESGTVQVIDLRSGEIAATYALSARATLYTSHTGRYAYAVQGGGNVVNVIDSGVSQVWHDDHYDTEIGEVALLDFAIEGQRPIHFVMWEDQVTVFNDGDGSVAIFSESGITDGSVTVQSLSTERPHHGVGAAVGGYVLLGIPNMVDEDDSLATGVEVRTLDGEEVARFEDCPGLHGEAHAGENGIAFACTDGVLLVTWNGDTFTGTKLAYPEGSGDLRAGTLRAAHGGQYILGNFGPDLIRIDYAAETIERIALPAAGWRFEVYPEDPAHAVVLTMDGALHLLDIASGEVEGSVAVVDPFTRPSRPAARPAFALNGHTAYVSDPLPGDIATVDLETMAVAEERIFVGGKPSSLTAFGMMGEDHHAHEGEEHAHDHGEFDPHIWHDPNNAMLMVENIRAALAAADAANAVTYSANAEAYTAELTALDAYIREQVATIPEANRLIVTSHDTFSYFAGAYGFTVMNILGSVSTETADPGAGEIAELVAEIQESSVPAIFTENITNPALVERVAQEAGVTLARTLYTDALGQPGTPGESYLLMVRYNVDTMVEALQ
jgi:ABC-type Zn uptake system ZnuABC Zn-binding protein ZnuA